MATLNSWQRIDRVLNGKPWGNGTDGDITLSGTLTNGNANWHSPFTGTSGQSSGQHTAGWSGGPFLCFIHQSRGNGQWEINYITSISGTTITLSKPLQYTYTTGAQIIIVRMYNAVTLSSPSVMAWNGSSGGISVICGKTSISGGGATASNLGLVGGTGRAGDDSTIGYQGEGYTATGGISAAANTSGGGGANRSGGAGGAGGGGNANAGSNGNPANGSNGRGGAAVGSADGTTIFFGGAGGGSAIGSGQSAVYNGGNSGGILVFITKAFSPTSAIATNGQTPGGRTDVPLMGAGGGAGGFTLVVCETATGVNNLTSAAGAGGAGESGKKGGGAGSVGRIAVHYRTSVSGTSSPASTNTQDTTLKELVSSNFFAFF